MSSGEIESEVRVFLKNELGIRVEELSDNDPLFSAGLLDSLSALNVITFLEQRYELKIGALDVTVQDIDSVAMIATFARRRMAA